MDFTKTIIPLALMASESIAHSAFGLIDSEPIRARGIIVKYTDDCGCRDAKCFIAQLYIIKLTSCKSLFSIFCGRQDSNSLS